MKTKDLLACVTPGATAYIQKTINTKNKADYQKLKKLFDDQRFEAKSFDDTELDILAFDWQSLEQDRNWWWQLQALPFLNWFTNSFALQSEEERTRYFSLCLDAIHCWMKQAKRKKASPLVWHDHAAAFRVRNLTNWLAFCHFVELPVGEEDRAKTLASLIIEHLDWFQEDKHYSKHTNHGFDQAMIVLTIGLMFDRDDFEAYRHRNRERLKDEVTFAFTAEGVHKENSPGYQKMMLGRLKQLRTLAPLGEQDLSQMGERYLEKAEVFLRAITLPNGYLPMIGDTRGGDEGLPYEQKDQVDVLDYSASGYAIIRGADGRGKQFYILLKNTHESNYHRHDDDMMVYLFYDGEVVLGDGGLYKHQEDDRIRKHLRSYLSHSVPYSISSPIRNNDNLIARPSVSRKGGLSFHMESMMFGDKVERDVLVDPALKLRVEIDDSLASGDREVCSNFFFDQVMESYLKNSSMVMEFKSFDFVIEFSPDSPFSVKKGDLGIGSLAVVSHEYDLYQSAMMFSVKSPKIAISLEPR